MSQTIYARVSDQLKAAVDDHAARSGQTLAGAVADLLDCGLQATADEHSIKALKENVRTLKAEVETYEEREKAWAAFAQRTALKVGSCPSCGHDVSGRDLLVDGLCRNCGANLSPLLGTGPKVKKGGLNEGDFNLLLGALGLVLAVALVTQQGGGG
jgi:hypothetical protein